MLHLFTFHRAGSIEHQRHIFFDNLLGVYIGGYQQSEEAIFSAFFEAEQINPHIISRNAVEDAEIGGRQYIEILPANQGVETTIAVNADRVTGRVDGFDGLTGRDINGNGNILKRAMREALCTKRVDILNQTIINGQDLAVLDFDAARIAGVNGKDAGLE